MSKAAEKPNPDQKGSRSPRVRTRVPRRQSIDTMKIGVAGYKSIFEEREVEVRPLTLLAGANSAGKSSMFQPLLLLKQTIEETYDPGALLLNGNNVKFTAVDQMLWNSSQGERIDTFSIRFNYNSESLTLYFRKQQRKGFDVCEMIFESEKKQISLRPGMSHKQIESILPAEVRRYRMMFSSAKDDLQWVVSRNRCFLQAVLEIKSDPGSFAIGSYVSDRFLPIIPRIQNDVRSMIHLPGLRGNPERTYSVGAVGSTFPGTFEKYAASVIAEWQEQDDDKLEELCEDLRRLNLTSRVSAQRVNDAEVELQVGRLPDLSNGLGNSDMVNIADVGFGMSQTLPVIVALHVARPGQIVYIEQPELHLHPRAQVAMAEVLARAAQRGVRVVAETHSSLLLMGIQTLVAEEKLKPELVKLHWFTRENGSTQITPADLDQAGRFGDWPMDFDDVSLETQSRYLDAAEEQLARS